MWYTYILLCDDKSLYTGITNDLAKRLADHKSGKGARYTKAHPADKMLYYETFDSRSSALIREAKIKKLKRFDKLLLTKSRRSEEISNTKVKLTKKPRI